LVGPIPSSIFKFSFHSASNYPTRQSETPNVVMIDPERLKKRDRKKKKGKSVHASCCHSGQPKEEEEEEEKKKKKNSSSSELKEAEEERDIERGGDVCQPDCKRVGRSYPIPSHPIPSHPPSSHPPAFHSASNYPTRQSNKCGDCSREYGKRQEKREERRKEGRKEGKRVHAARVVTIVDHQRRRIR
jgi:hypothetical protein